MTSVRLMRWLVTGTRGQVLFRVTCFVLGVSFSCILSFIWNSTVFFKETSHVKQSHEQSRDSRKIGEEALAFIRVAGHTRRRTEDAQSVGPRIERQRIGTGCVKSLHIFADFEVMKGIPELKHLYSLLQGSNETDQASDLECGFLGYECDLRISVGLDINSFRGKDAVMFGMILSQWREHRTLINEILKTSPEPGQTWIYYSAEPPYRLIRITKTLNFTRFKYHVLMSYDSKSDIHIPFGYYRRFDADERATDTRFLSDGFYNVNRTGLISWVAANCVAVSWPRNHFVQELQKLLPGMDTYGRCGAKKCHPFRSDVCNKLFASYKFFLALPNSECHDYITEKFWMMSLQYGAVPVVVGAPKADYAKVAPPNSFVHVGDFKSLTDLADHLIRVYRDEELYRKYHDWRHYGEVVTSFPMRPNSMCRTIPHIYPRKPDDVKYIGDSSWYKGCRVFPSERDFGPFIDGIGDWTVWR